MRYWKESAMRYWKEFATATATATATTTASASVALEDMEAADFEAVLEIRPYVLKDMTWRLVPGGTLASTSELLMSHVNAAYQFSWSPTQANWVTTYLLNYRTRNVNFGQGAFGRLGVQPRQEPDHHRAIAFGRGLGTSAASRCTARSIRWP